ncbi:arsenite-translocating ATPase, ArsA family [Galdieria sulphuraria]|uniref:Arsenite-translocating ATPase, ArsA family n=1 Tax=Galdieria sulphuraria TaxID=130081 RepID=M2XUU5_GALSU|nr:arsenite-translocating ATPase, ArsA family [Galdieria sulphuraria]EME27403.1 arsenite-translocating ATPase, ArsA family [Galdieria sulphuraria]|eukprot:XP_005703923.1 arsenite-translocating ATPase, ArsA family [Galdieria sulphuraria]
MLMSSDCSRAAVSKRLYFVHSFDSTCARFSVYSRHLRVISFGPKRFWKQYGRTLKTRRNLSSSPCYHCCVHEKDEQLFKVAVTKREEATGIKFVCGKGGVGKTTCAAAYGVYLAERGYRTLIVSSDPAHSLADSLDIDLKKGEISPVVGCENLWALEVDTTAAVGEFRDAVSSLTSINQTVDKELQDWASRLGIEEFRDILDNIPPGADEFIALTKVFVSSETTSNRKYDYLVIDTAPTGHTIRLLAFPDFLSRFLSKALALRGKLDGALNRVNNLFSLVRDKHSFNKNVISNAVKRITQFQEQMQQFHDQLRDTSRTDFIVVTIASNLSLEESTRLVYYLKTQQFHLERLIVNQLISADTKAAYWQSLMRGQQRVLSRIKENVIDKPIIQIPYLGAEIEGFKGIRQLSNYLDDELHQVENKVFDEWLIQKKNSNREDDDTSSLVENGCQYIFVGGKGGVGKTSISSSLSVLMSKERRVLIVSTDPAHSLGDALETKLSGSPTFIQDNLYAMEIDPEQSIQEFRQLLLDLQMEDSNSWGSEVVRTLGLGDFMDILDNPPPGTDELVALTKVIELVDLRQFDLVIIDTAPTGHTLRLLAFPEFIERLLGRVLSLKKRLDGTIGMVTSLFRRSDVNSSIQDAVSRIENFRSRMVLLRNILVNEKLTSFCVVTIPTELSYQESMRLLQSLSSSQVKVLGVFVNQVISSVLEDESFQEVVRVQTKYLDRLRQLAKDNALLLVSMPFFDMEVRGVSVQTGNK